jgi:predicted acylesterase/phospholipase RssA
MNNYDTLVLSGASQKGFILLGSLQYAMDNFMLKNIETYVGTSAGAIICYLLIIGYTPIEIVVYLCTNQILEKMSTINIMNMIKGSGGSSFNHVHEHLEKMTIAKLGYLPTLMDLKTKLNKVLICITHNMTENKSELISPDTFPTIPCLSALRMSSNLPFVFDRYKYGHSFYLDGGISDNFGIQVGEELGKKILGITLMNPSKTSIETDDINTLEYLYNIMMVPIDTYIKYKIEKASDKCTIICLKSPNNKFFNFEMESTEKMDMFVSGYQQITTFIEKKPVIEEKTDN